MKKKPLKIIFAGTPDFAAVALKSLLSAKHDICAVYCQPDRPSGRGKKLIAGPVKQLALENDIPVEQPLNFKSQETIDILQNYQADLMIVVAYGLLLPKLVLSAPRFGCINIHGSLLPKWRGAAPIHRAIQAGDQETGITIMQMDEGLDTGNMLLKKICPIASDETGSSLHDKLAGLGGEAINEYLRDFSIDNAKAKLAMSEKQNNTLATYAHKLTKQEAEIDWTESTDIIERKIRAFNAWPVCFTFVQQKRMRIWQAYKTDTTDQHLAGTVIKTSHQGIDVVCGDQKVLRLTFLQLDGSKAMDASALLNARQSWFDNFIVLG